MVVCWVIWRGQQIYTVIQAVHSLLYIVTKCYFFSVVTWKVIIQNVQICEGCTHFCEILFVSDRLFIISSLRGTHFLMWLLKKSCVQYFKYTFKSKSFHRLQWISVSLQTSPLIRQRTAWTLIGVSVISSDLSNYGFVCVCSPWHRLGDSAGGCQ